MATKTKHSIYYDSSVNANATDIQTTPIIPNGRAVTVQKFGCFDPSIGDNLDSIVALQWGSGTSWQMVRVIGKVFETEINRDFQGDGTKRFRIVRMNKSASPKAIYAFIEALVHDA